MAIAYFYDETTKDWKPIIGEKNNSDVPKHTHLLTDIVGAHNSIPELLNAKGYLDVNKLINTQPLIDIPHPITFDAGIFTSDTIVDYQEEFRENNRIVIIRGTLPSLFKHLFLISEFSDEAYFGKDIAFIRHSPSDNRDKLVLKRQGEMIDIDFYGDIYKLQPQEGDEVYVEINHNGRDDSFDIEYEIQEWEMYAKVPSKLSQDNSNLLKHVPETWIDNNNTKLWNPRRLPMSYVIDMETDRSAYIAWFDNGCGLKLSGGYATDSWGYGINYDANNHKVVNANYIPQTILKTVQGQFSIEYWEQAKDSAYRWVDAVVINPINDSSKFNFDNASYNDNEEHAWQTARQKHVIRVMYELGVWSESTIIRFGAVKK